MAFNRLELETTALARKHRELVALKADIEVREGRIRLALAEVKKPEVRVVERGTAVVKVWPGKISLADEVVLRGCIREEYMYHGEKHEAEDACYKYVNKSTPEGVEHFGEGCHDHTGPTFLDKAAAASWNRLARAMNRLLAAHAVRIVKKCACRD